MHYKLWDCDLHQYFWDGYVFKDHDEIHDALIDYGQEFGDGSPEDQARARNLGAIELADLLNFTVEETEEELDNNTLT